MKNSVLYICILGLFSLFTYCSTLIYTVSESGDNATLELKNGYSMETEIISFTDSSLIFIPLSESNPRKSIRNDSSKIYYVLNEDIKSIYIKGFDGSGWGTYVGLFQVLPIGLTAVAAASIGANPLGPIVVFGVPALVTTLFFSSSGEEPPQWDSSMDISELSSLKIYSRYPNNLSLEELGELLNYRVQKEIVKFQGKVQ